MDAFELCLGFDRLILGQAIRQTFQSPPTPLPDANLSV